MIWKKRRQRQANKANCLQCFVYLGFVQPNKEDVQVQADCGATDLFCLAGLFQNTVCNFGIQHLQQPPLDTTFLSPAGHYRNSGHSSHHYYRLINLAKPLQKSRKSSMSQPLGHKKNKASRRLITGCYFQCKNPSRTSPNFNNKAMHCHPSIPAAFCSWSQGRTC